MALNAVAVGGPRQARRRLRRAPRPALRRGAARRADHVRADRRASAGTTARCSSSAPSPRRSPSAWALARAARAVAPHRHPDRRRHRHLRRVGRDRDRRRAAARRDSPSASSIFTIAGVTALSTLAMILYPVDRRLARASTRSQAGIFLGGTIHDVAQVVGAGYSISPEVGDYAVLTKMLRVAMLLPVVMVISLVVRHRLQPRATRAAAIRCCRRSCSPSSRFVVVGSLGLDSQAGRRRAERGRARLPRRRDRRRRAQDVARSR